ncbi:YrhA family protein [Dyella silvatica]|uniref:YrhA family protein n=1 Tax=Dyella silvatica TaxID=2992128 RepID=UPI00224DA317|nr:YrhA family protein [Dyella silvatica]
MSGQVENPPPSTTREQARILSITSSAEPIYLDLLKQLEAEQRKYGDALPPAATEIQIAELQQAAQREFALDLPQGYLAFLRLSNGLEWDGVCIFSSSKTTYAGHPERTFFDLVEHNIYFRDPLDMRDYLLLGSDDMDVYVYHLPTGMFEVRDRVPFDNLYASFKTFDELAVHALKRSLKLHE